MKIKIKDQEAMHISGVVFYGDLQRLSHRNYGSSRHLRKQQKNTSAPGQEGLKDKASKFTEEMINQIKQGINSFSNTQNNKGDGHPQNDKTAEQGDGHPNFTEQGDGHPNFTFPEEDNRMHNFEGAMNRFGEMMTAFGQHMEKNAKKWDENAVEWSKNFESKAEEFGERMEVWGEELGTKMEAWGKEFEKMWEGSANNENETFTDVQWIQDYPIFEMYNRLYDGMIMNHPDLIEKNHYYEVQLYELEQMDEEVMTMVGSRMSTVGGIEAPVVSMTFNPDHWLVVKMNEEEYKKDWLKSLEKSEALNGYDIEPYILIKHAREMKEDMIKIYCPLKVKDHE